MAELLNYGAMGLGLAMAILSYRLLSEEGKREPVRPVMLTAIIIFFMLSLVIFAGGVLIETKVLADSEPSSNPPPGSPSSSPSGPPPGPLQNVIGKDEIKILKKEYKNLKDNAITKEENIKLGIYYSMLKVFNKDGVRNNEVQAREILLKFAREAHDVENTKYTTEQWNEIIRSLLWIRRYIQKEEDFKLVEDLIKKRYGNGFDEVKQQALIDRSLLELYWVKAYKKNNKRENYEKVLYHLLRLRVSESDSFAFNNDDMSEVMTVLNKLSGLRAHKDLLDNKEELQTAFEENITEIIESFIISWAEKINYPGG